MHGFSVRLWISIKEILTLPFGYLIDQNNTCSLIFRISIHLCVAHTHVVMQGNRFFLSACSSDAANFKSVGRGLFAQLFSASTDLRLFQMTLNLNKQDYIFEICSVN